MVNLYVAGATLGATTTAAVAAVWILGPGGSLDGTGGSAARSAATQVMDMQVAPYMARIDYQGGSSALIPISLAFRVDSKEAGQKFCKDLKRIQREVNAFMRTNVGNKFQWKAVAASGLDKKLTIRVNKIVGGSTVTQTFMAAGDKGVGDKPMSCSRLARKG